MSAADTVVARILYWGIEGAGKTANLRTIHARLKANSRGQLSSLPTRLDPTVHYERLPIELGEVKGVRARLEVIAVPGAPEQAPTRKQLLDQVAGIVLVVDAQRDRIDENVASYDELRSALAAYGRRLEEIPVVVQYNKHDLSDPVALDALHRKLDVPGAAVFETVATEPGGPLRTLTTISKRVLQVLRDSTTVAAAQPSATPVRAPRDAPAPPARAATPPPGLGRDRTEIMEAAILAEADTPVEPDDPALRAHRALDRTWQDLAEEAGPGPGLRLGSDLRIVSAGVPEIAGPRAVRVPVVLGDAEGRTVSLAVTIQLDPLLDPPPTDEGEP